MVAKCPIDEIVPETAEKLYLLVWMRCDANQQMGLTKRNLTQVREGRLQVFTFHKGRYMELRYHAVESKLKWGPADEVQR
jgi:hypothetical protein